MPTQTPTHVDNPGSAVLIRAWHAILRGSTNSPQEWVTARAAQRYADAQVPDRRDPTWHLTAVSHHHNLITAGYGADLNDRPPSPARLSALFRIEAAGPDGLEARHVTMAVRRSLANRGWVSVHTRDGADADVRHPYARLHLTEHGQAHVATGRVRVLDLSPPQAGALAAVAAAGPNGHQGWPGDVRTREFAVGLHLVTVTPDPDPGRIGHRYTLTDHGRDALSTYRDHVAPPAVPTAAQARLLDAVNTLLSDDAKIGTATDLLRRYAAGTVAVCRRNGWITGDPRYPTLTGDGVAALRRAPLPAPRAPGKPSDLPARPCTATQVEPGQVVRLRKRARYGVGPEWVQVVRVRVVPRVGRMPGGVQVFVCPDQGTGEMSYPGGGVILHPRTGFDVIA